METLCFRLFVIQLKELPALTCHNRLKSKLFIERKEKKKEMERKRGRGSTSSSRRRRRVPEGRRSPPPPCQLAPLPHKAQSPGAGRDGQGPAGGTGTGTPSAAPPHTPPLRRGGERPLGGGRWGPSPRVGAGSRRGRYLSARRPREARARAREI